jgi:predicted  nucleic acid-binding Zn-ribbon protein
VEELETQGLTLLDAITAQETAMQAAEAEAELRDQALLNAVQLTDHATQAAQQQLDALAGLRVEATKAIPAELLTIYDEVNARHPGNALCHLDGEFCGGCQGNLNTQLLMQVRARREILRCPQCLRILDV